MLYGISWKNLNLYSRAIPLYDDMDDEHGSPLFDDRMDVNNPDNFRDMDHEEEIIKA